MALETVVCCSGDMTVLICHVISEVHVIKGSFNLWVEAPYGKSPPCQIWWPCSIVVVEIGP